MYYVSKTILEAKACYFPLDKAILALIHTPKKISYYFQAYTIIVLTELLLQALLRKSNFTGRVAKWRTILGYFDIKYLPYTATKGQVLFDLVAKFIECSPKEGTTNEGEAIVVALISIFPPIT